MDKVKKLLIICSLILIGLNLRPSMAAIGPLLTSIQRDINLNYSQISLLTMLPVLAMGGAMFFGGKLTKKFNSNNVVIFCLLIIGISNFIRFFNFNIEFNLFFSAITAGCGVAIIQVIMPTLIKKNFKDNVSFYIGIYVTAIMGGAALTASTVPLIESFTNSWKVALSFWSLLSILAVIFWINTKDQFVDHILPTGEVLFKPYKIPRSWTLAIFFGLGTASYTCVLAWLPPYYLELGKSSSEAGLLLAFLTGCEVLAGLIFPAWANRKKDIRLVLFFIIICAILGYLGLILLPNTIPYFWMLFLGLGIGGLFPMTLILTMQHFDDPQNAGHLTAFVQGVGYLIAAFSPLIAGILRDFTSSFSISWSFLLIITFVMLFFVPLFNPKNFHLKMMGSNKH